MKELNKVAVVIPTVRKELFLEWLSAWKWMFTKHKVTLYVVEDNETKTIKMPKIKNVIIKHYCWKDIKEDKDIPKGVIYFKTDSIRNYGFYKAWKDGNDMTVTLDDDCFPAKSYVTNETLDIIEEYKHGFKYEAENTGYFNVGNLIKSNEDLFMRGYPFKLRNKVSPVVIQYGGWNNVPDFDAITQLSLEHVNGYTFYERFSVIPRYHAFTGCIMNAAWLTEYTNYMYQIKDERFNRWGDIWGGLLAKSMCDYNGVSIAINGFAKITHTRASDPIKNLNLELSGYGINEVFWEKLMTFNKFPNEIENFDDILNKWNSLFR